MIRNTIVTMQYALAFAYKAELMKKDLVKKTQEATHTLQQLIKVEAARIRLLDKFNVARRSEQWVEAMAKAAEERAAKAENDLAEALATKDAEIKAADEKAYAEGQADKLFVSKDSPIRDFGQLKVHSLLLQSKEEEVEVEVDVAVGAKSPTLNDQVMNLTEKDEVEVSKSTTSKKADTSKAEIAVAGKSLDDTLREIDEEIATDAKAENGTTLSTKADTLPNAEVERTKDTNP
ncbi:hypothetical protein CsSME_00053406 [Camellia sinensis var. sinensis]